MRGHVVFEHGLPQKAASVAAWPRSTLPKAPKENTGSQPTGLTNGSDMTDVMDPGVQVESEQDVDPAELTNPAGHAVHAEALVRLLYIPDMQAVQTNDRLAPATLP